MSKMILKKKLFLKNTCPRPRFDRLMLEADAFFSKAQDCMKIRNSNELTSLLLPGSCLSPNKVGTISIGSQADGANNGDNPGSGGDTGELKNSTLDSVILK